MTGEWLEAFSPAYFLGIIEKEEQPPVEDLEAAVSILKEVLDSKSVVQIAIAYRVSIDQVVLEGRNHIRQLESVITKRKSRG